MMKCRSACRKIMTEKRRKMVKKLCVVILFVFFASRVYCDSFILQTYKQRFSRADLSIKAHILEGAAYDRSISDSLGEFYDYAAQFALDNFEILKNDPDMIRIIGIAVNGLRNTGYSESLDSLWRLFMGYQDSAIGTDILVTMGKLGKKNTQIIDSINNYLMEKNFLYISGENINYAMISACIAAIMELGDNSSYPVLFAVLCAGYPEVISYEAQGALELIPGNYKQFLIDTIMKNPPEEKFIALRAGTNSVRLSISDRGQIAELALEQSLASYSDEESDGLSALRYAAVLALTPLRWTRANALAIRNYYRVLSDYQHNDVPKERFIEAIRLLGAVGNSDAALALGLQLGLINARTEKYGEFDAEITLAIVRALGLIGDKAAFDHLLNVNYLSYPDNILAAAKEAIDRLKW